MWKKVRLLSPTVSDGMQLPPEETGRVFCPFCGSRKLRLKPVWRTWHFVACSDCRAGGPVRKTGEEAWNAWATRWTLIPDEVEESLARQDCDVACGKLFDVEET